MNKRKTMKVLKRYFYGFVAVKNETKEQAIRDAVIEKKRYLNCFIKWVYEKYGEGDITKTRWIEEQDHERIYYVER